MGDERLDGLFMNAVQQSQGIDNFFTNLFGFFRRRTDFYGDESQSRAKLMSGFETNLKLYQEDQDKKKKLDAKKLEEKKLTNDRIAAEAIAKKMKEEQEDAQVCEITDEEANALNAASAAKKEEKPAEVEEEKKKEEGEEKEGEEKEDKGVKPNEGNGGKTEKYDWEQTLSEVTVNVFLPPNIMGKHLTVTMGIRNCSVKVKGAGGATLVEGEWCESIIQDESLWCIEEVHGKRVLQMNITKKNQMGWWNCIIKGESIIDTQKVEPENSKLSDLDGETRSTVEKMMYDQKQKQMGLPTSEEQEKKNKLSAFMSAHPEMDFSQAKFC